ncbi:MAG: F0F1 ATP synthase subunit B, partial [Alphaproteobacteria bacterium]
MDASFWVAVAFVLFVALIAKRGYKFITEGLDKRAGRIKTELDEAVRLREEALALLAGYQRKQRDAVRDAEEIVERAKREAARIAAQAEEDLAAALERRTRVAEVKISQAEAQALAEVRNQAVDMTLAATRRLLAE